MKMIPTFGLTSRFFIPAMRLLTGRSGISSVRSSSSCTNPGASPLGEQSMLVPFEVPITRNGAAAIKAPDLGDVVGFLSGDVGERLGINLREIVQRRTV